MPFTFKLSQRLARMKLPLAIAAAAFAACLFGSLIPPHRTAPSCRSSLLPTLSHSIRTRRNNSLRTVARRPATASPSP